MHVCVEVFLHLLFMTNKLCDFVMLECAPDNKQNQLMDTHIYVVIAFFLGELD